MAKALHKLTDREVRNAKEGRHSDGGGLYLVAGTSARRWVFMYRLKRPRGEGAAPLREMPLGRFGEGVDALSLAEARLVAAEKRKVVADGGDPAAAPVLPVERKVPTFGDMADELIAAKDYRSEKSKARIKRALEYHAALLRPKTVDTITTDDVKAVLDPIWRETPIMAEKVRGYIWQVMENSNDHYTGRNPATWTGRLEKRLPKRKRLKKGSHPALPYAQIGAFITALHGVEDENALALEFLIQTATRTKEVRLAKRADIDLESAVWTLSPEDTKSERLHKVTLNARALAIVREMDARGRRADGYVFSSKLRGRSGENVLNDIIKVMNGDEPKWTDPEQGNRPITPHGFRSTFRDWAEFEAGLSFELAEQALSHAIGDKTVRAYRRGDALEPRRVMMEAWGTYCGGAAGGNVAPFKRSEKAA